MSQASNSAIAIIPARLGSTRLPRKVLASDTGKPMVVHVCEQADKASRVARVVVATDSTEIREAVEAHGFACIMTSADHPNGTSRLNEAAQHLELADHDLVVNVQGDEPEIEPGTIDAAIDCLQPDHVDCACGTVMTRLRNPADRVNPNIVKVVSTINAEDPSGQRRGLALYFSRSAIPSGEAPAFRHIGVYAYTAGALRRYVALSPGPLEQSERLEQLRWLEHHDRVAISLVDSGHTGIDTPEQYEAFAERWKRGQA